jgi:hypothetical protein
MKANTTMTATQRRLNNNASLAPSEIYNINYTDVNVAILPNTTKHQHAFNMASINRYAKKNSAIARSLQDYKECIHTADSYEYEYMLMETTATIASEIVLSIDYSDHLQLMNYAKVLYMAYSNYYNGNGKINKTAFFYYEVYSRMHSFLQLIINDSYELYGAPMTTATAPATAQPMKANTTMTATNESNSTAADHGESNDVEYECVDDVIIHNPNYGIELCNCILCTATRRNESNSTAADNTNTSTAADHGESNNGATDHGESNDGATDDYDDDDEVIHLYFNALCNCCECAKNKPAIEKIEYNAPVVITTATATTTTYTLDKNNEKKPLISIYSSENKTASVSHSTTKYFPSENKFITTYTPNDGSHYNAPAPAPAIDYNAPAIEYYNVFIQREQREQRRNTAQQREQQQRQQREQRKYKNMAVKTVYEKMTAQRRNDKIKSISDRIMNSEINEYYNTPMEHGNQ